MIRLLSLLLLTLSAISSSWSILSGIKQTFFFNNPFSVKKVVMSKLVYPSSFTEFGPLDDVVMGGSSSSSFVNGRWRGTIVTKSGGFCGIRSKAMELNASSYTGFELKLKGGGNNRYKFSVRDSTEWNGPAFTWSFDTKESGTTIKLPFNKAIPTKFAKTVSNVSLDKAKISSIQFTYSKFEFDGGLNPKFSGDGPFDLSVVSISLY